MTEYCSPEYGWEPEVVQGGKNKKHGEMEEHLDLLTRRRWTVLAEKDGTRIPGATAEIKTIVEFIELVV